MNKDRILEGVLGDLIVALTAERCRATQNNQHLHALIAESLRDVFTKPPRSLKPAAD